MEQRFHFSMSREEFEKLIQEAVDFAVSKKISSTSDDKYFTIEEAATYMRCSRFRLWQLRNDGLLKFTTSGRRVLIKKSAVDSLLSVNQKKVCHG